MEIGKEILSMEVSLEGAQHASNLHWLGERAWEGQEIVILREGKPYLKLIPHPDGEPSGEILPRPFGLQKGLIWISPDFDEPDQELIDAFEGKYANDEVVFEGFYIKPESSKEVPNSDTASAKDTSF